MRGNKLRKVTVDCFGGRYNAPGVFHMWGTELERCVETGNDYPCTRAVVELHTGEVALFGPDRITFTEPSE